MGIQKVSSKGAVSEDGSSDVPELTPYGWKGEWAKVVEDHRASILERFATTIGA
jgi:hypothetical protein